MALLSSSLGGEVGLRLLLSPVGSNVIARTGCIFAGVGFPVYSTFKAIERKDPLEQEQWLVYWAVYGCFSIAEIFSDKLLSWFPCYYHAKLAFLIWLQLPLSDGAKLVFLSYLRPFLLKHQARLDRIVDGSRNDINNFIVSHQQEIQFIKALCQKVAVTVYRAAEDVVRTSRTTDLNSSSPTSGNSQASDGNTQLSQPPIEDPGWIDVARDESP